MKIKEFEKKINHLFDTFCNEDSWNKFNSFFDLFVSNKKVVLIEKISDERLDIIKVNKTKYIPDSVEDLLLFYNNEKTSAVKVNDFEKANEFKNKEIWIGKGLLKPIERVQIHMRLSYFVIEMGDVVLFYFKTNSYFFNFKLKKIILKNN